MNGLSRSMSLVGGAAALLLLAGAASAAKVSEAQKRYQEERAVCMKGASNQDRATCLKEAAAALQEAKREGLATSGDAKLKQNSLTRCNAVPAKDREDCVARIEQGKTTGSAQQGGILRESERPVAKP